MTAATPTPLPPEPVCPDDGQTPPPTPTRANPVRSITGVLHGWPLSWRLIAILVTLLTAALMVATFATSTAMRNYMYDSIRSNLKDEAAIWSRFNAVQGRSFDPDSCLGRTTSVWVVPERRSLRMPPGAGPSPYKCVSTMDPKKGPDFTAWYAHNYDKIPGEFFPIPSIADDDGWLALAGNTANGTGVFIVAAPLEPVNMASERIRWLMMVISAILVGSCVLIGWFAIQRAFRPLRVIEDTASSIAQGDLTQRIPERVADDELSSLTQSLNAMLAHIESAFAVREASEDRMRRFVTDASHELRTPLATIRGYAELYRQGAACSPDAVAGSMDRIENEATRMAGLVEDLLTLARLDNSRPMECTVVDLTVAAADVVQDAIARDPSRTIRLLGLRASGLGPTLVHGDEAKLRQVFTNVMANAMAHTPPGTPIEVVVGISSEGRPRVEVRDHGAGIPPERIGMVFERFYRADPARSRETGGTGLGLAIVAAIVHSHGGRVGVGETPGGGATFVIDLPAPDGLPEDDEPHEDDQ